MTFTQFIYLIYTSLFIPARLEFLSMKPRPRLWILIWTGLQYVYNTFTMNRDATGWAKVHISHRVIVFIFYGKKMKCIRILGHKWIHKDSDQINNWIHGFLQNLKKMYSDSSPKIKSIRIQRDIDISRYKRSTPQGSSAFMLDRTHE